MLPDLVVVGATGAVGRMMLRVLEERDFPLNSIRLLSSQRSAGTTLVFGGREHEVELLTEQSFKGGEVILSSAGGSVSKWFVPIAREAGCVVVDNTSAFRMDPDVPLVVPEVNPEDIDKHSGVIANPNCSTIQMVVALKPLHDAARIKRIVVSTYQAVSGAGWKAMEELRSGAEAFLAGRQTSAAVFPERIAFNVLPQIPQSNAFGANLYSTEEMKMVNETRKIFHEPDIQVSATTVRVPVLNCHSEAVNITTERKLTRPEALELLRAAEGVVVVDSDDRHYPTVLDADDRDEVFVGRVREDISQPNGLDLWIVADNLRKGAATNAVQIAERLKVPAALDRSARY